MIKTCLNFPQNPGSLTYSSRLAEVLVKTLCDAYEGKTTTPAPPLYGRLLTLDTVSSYTSQTEELSPGYGVTLDQRTKLYAKTSSNKGETATNRDKVYSSKNETASKKADTAGKKAEAASNREEAASKKDETISKKAEAAGKKNEATSKKAEATGKKDEATSNREEAASKKFEATNNEDKATSNKTETTSNKVEFCKADEKSVPKIQVIRTSQSAEFARTKTRSLSGKSSDLFEEYKLKRRDSRRIVSEKGNLAVNLLDKLVLAAAEHLYTACVGAKQNIEQLQVKLRGKLLHQIYQMEHQLKGK